MRVSLPVVLPNAIKSRNIYTVAEEVTQLGRKLHIHSPDDWYRVPKLFVRQLGHSFLLKKYKSVEAFVREAYPQHKWDHNRFFTLGSRSILLSQRFLERIIKTIFPENTKIEFNIRAPLELIGDSGSPLEIDIYLPQYKIGFEYQDPHHYFHSTYGSVTLHEFKERDKRKAELAQNKGLTLIYVPFWWDWNIDSLIATIKQRRSDLFSDINCVLPPFELSPPPEIIEKFNYEIPDFGVPMFAMNSPQGKQFDPSGWWIFEKYDGVRAIWNPKRRLFYTRWGTELSIPNYIVDSMTPHFWIDSEVWFGRERGTRNLALKIISLTAPWDKVNIMAFDAPSRPLRNKDYDERYKYLQENTSADHPYVKVASYEVATGKQSVESIRANHGEGIILRDPSAPYDPGYSHFIYKHKGFKDAEAQVLRKISPNTFFCKMSKLHLLHNLDEQKDTENDNTEQDNDNDVPEQEVDEETIQMMERRGRRPRINVDVNDSSNFYEMEMTVDQQLFIDEIEEIKEGSFVSFKYHLEHSRGGPPKIYAMRNDIQNWEQLLHSKRKSPEHQRIWTASPGTDWKDLRNRRKFLDNYAKSHNFDPLIAENWYSQTAISVFKEGGGFMEYYGKSLPRAISALYPSVVIDPSKFGKVSQKFWTKEEIRKFFDNFADNNKFDPLVPENWYKITSTDIINVKKGKVVLMRYSGLSDALRDIYPFLDWDASKFKTLPSGHWKDKSNRRKFFIEYATEKEFDPLLPENWRKMRMNFLSYPRSRSVLAHYTGRNYFKAILDLFPEIPKDKLTTKREQGFWGSMENQREFLDEFARKRGFNPLNPENWYKVMRPDLEQSGGLGLFARHTGMFQALQANYPNIGLEIKYFFNSKRKRQSLELKGGKKQATMKEM